VDAKKRSEKPDLDLDLLPGLIGYQLRLAQIAIFRDFNSSVGALDVSPGLFGVLVIIDANAGLTQNALAKATHLDRSTVVTVIDKLEERGLVQRRAAVPDRRAYALVLTPDGVKLVRKLKTLVREHESRLCANLSNQEREQLVRLLQRIFPELR